MRADLVFYGHTHRQSDVWGDSRYLNPGSLGCHNEAKARYIMLEVGEGSSFEVEWCEAEYDDGALFGELDRRKVPCRESFRESFFRRE
jgi:hypothetical protein